MSHSTSAIQGSSHPNLKGNRAGITTKEKGRESMPGNGLKKITRILPSSLKSSQPLASHGSPRQNHRPKMIRRVQRQGPWVTAAC